VSELLVNSVLTIMWWWHLLGLFFRLNSTDSMYNARSCRCFFLRLFSIWSVLN